MLKKAGVRVLFTALAGLAGSALYAQSVISAHSGLIHYVEGDVFLADKAVEMKYSVFPEVKDNEVLRTAEGRAEVLLTPGVFLRLPENSSFRMVSNRLTDTRVEALTGGVLLESAELLPGNAITLLYKGQEISISKNGLYRIDVEGGTFRVYNGEAVITRGGETFTVKQAKIVNLNDAVLTATRFDAKTGDDFFRWASRRAEYLSMANVAAAKQMYDNGTQLSSSQWAWNPWFGMFTYLPYRGSYMSPFGYGFWSPGQIVNVAYPRYFGGGGYGYGGGGGTTSGTRYDSNLGYNVGSRGADTTSYSPASSSSVSSGSASTAASAPAASASRGGDSGGSRGSSSGGGRGH